MNISSGTRGWISPLHGSRYIVASVGVLVAVLGIAALLLVYNLPNANAFNEQVERLFISNDNLASPSEIRLLEILAQSGTAFSDTLTSYRYVILVLMLFSASMLVASIVFLLNTVGLGRRISEVERAGMHVTSLIVSRTERMVYLNNLEFRLTPAALETLAVLCEARLDEEVLSGAEIEALITSRDAIDCEEAAGATRIKRLRDGLGNQIVSELLVRNIARTGYMLTIDKDAIRII